ncbi:hypothetical protein AMIS_79480 [Actinoplanes missouriensis 431]|uniref:Peptidoglycan binding domain-containing protein n=1 Tax=Actinoplanes missouriensis (strain ATCC 14538 / DSM 43046 / CBS 188.64 / JCM 3121 / NBRC 102363 / NCIMB 12654 / NRRL B-3342 / UNCC 431) TaxID=512565 RepID=I0HJI1_ACTM4|nr:hypothetical protein [Actinoplanes missouriensis]BAL93168.1 hypothetical protein AMIS_79480 [Actinoplanes missouriensis 431]
MRLRLPRRGPVRVVALTTAVALTAGAAGWFAATQVKSPADAAAFREPPVASLITVPVEKRTLTSTVTTQGSITYGKAQPITLTGTVAAGTGEAGPQLVTKTSAAGRTLREGDVLLEINGRPVFVLKGKVPMYRSLTKGAEGDDVRQVRAAMRRLLPGRGVAASGPLNESALSAIGAFYSKRGYAAAAPTTEQKAQLRLLERAVADTKEAGGQPLADAKADLAEFRRTYGISVPSGEILFLPKLPIRLTTVTAGAGTAPTGPVGTVADPALVVNATVSPEDAELLKPGMTATLNDTAGGTLTAKVTGLGAAYAIKADDDQESSSTGVPLQLKPTDATKATALNGQSVQVRITVGDTGGDVLAVPVAAVFTASDGQSRVTVATETGQTRDVPVDPGLTADGNVQVRPRDGAQLSENDRVVVSGS